MPPMTVLVLLRTISQPVYQRYLSGRASVLGSQKLSKASSISFTYNGSINIAEGVKPNDRSNSLRSCLSSSNCSCVNGIIFNRCDSIKNIGFLELNNNK